MKEISVKKNFIYNTLYQILTLLTPFITAPYISRILGADGVGIYSYTISVQTYFSLFAALGTASYGMREVAQARDDKEKCSKLFWEIELMTVFTSILCIIAWIILVLFSKEYKIYFIVLTMCLFATLFDISWFFSGLEQFRLIVSRNSIIKIISIICMFIFVKTKADLLKYIFIYSAGMMLGNLTMWTYLPQFLVKIDWKNLRIWNHFKETLIYFIPTIATSIYTVVDKTLIGIITVNIYENGYYEQATKVINMCKSITFASINSVMGARISYLYANNKIGEIKQRIEKSLSYILLIGFACMFGIIGVASNFVPTFFGQGYSKVIPLLYIFSPIIIIIGISNCLGSQYYTPSGKRALSSKFIVIGSIVNLILNLILIPYFSAIGSAFASVIAELVITIFYICYCNKIITIKMIYRHTWKRIIAGLIMLAIIFSINYVCESILLRLLIQIFIGSIAYFIILILLKDNFVKLHFEIYMKKLRLKNSKKI